MDNGHPMITIAHLELIQLISSTKYITIDDLQCSVRMWVGICIKHICFTYLDNCKAT